MSDSFVQNIQWFPGHMTKTLRLILSELKNADIIIELTDARIPISSRNPEINKIVKDKPRLFLLNKGDLADEIVTKEWITYYNEAENNAIAVNSKDKSTKRNVINKVHSILHETIENKKRRGMSGTKIRAMVVGVPNVGKSTFINTMSSSASAKTADKPGVTRGKQWVNTKELDLLDIPGVLWHKFNSQLSANHLAVTGAVSDSVIDINILAESLLAELETKYPYAVAERYGVCITPGAEQSSQISAIAKKRGMLLPGGTVDVERASIILIDEFRAGKLGRISLERPSDIEEITKNDT